MEDSMPGQLVLYHRIAGALSWDKTRFLQIEIQYGINQASKASKYTLGFLQW